MRIIGGQLKGRKIEQPDLNNVRPTKDRIREAVFNMIAIDIPGAKVLDLFSGSGSYGLEAISRGADEAVFVEKDHMCTGVIHNNIRKLGIENDTEVINKDAIEYMENIGKNTKFDVIFADPPYNKNLAKKTLIMVNQYDILSPSGILVIEYNRREDVSLQEGNVSILKQKTYNKIYINIYKRDD